MADERDSLDEMKEGGLESNHLPPSYFLTLLLYSMNTTVGMKHCTVPFLPAFLRESEKSINKRRKEKKLES